ncbi:MAG TPA: sigma factor-like helix-turn-helix DNA-binding protein, partial [Isosphaeraceae bacterium]|nr:sigma factor-like helix-turn-helix DNA-binding protein [Isosphaeraceae bacterium]
EIVQEARRRMTPKERAILARREQGLEWAEIAAEMGGSPDALRIRFSRAVARITRELGLDEGLDE